ncbi:iron ABC transporter permease [Rhodococcus sp. BP-252]|uniref:ABC transporter permease n=1 Tax=unclassified Rhodococcus (in: high G+C Gram-positive bacteria) TaxID=192944 RepID=UPI001C9B2D31|nr:MULTISPECIES: iron ABC transporter permease [unclassified Rhodococcus (in: high G+C Gram-positive bacteria)]MBY6411809.1 iron ABC transporter permease [Rhodococcus sp. BP-320]MBY6416563.1 iron ABC transporter permease [Rhodococcus sp. BP-321]MBY6420631.1 iron ABC transporter permease [Rhodococcus sp. BP-324]MBY6431586.1 iron ABC transporter permease [Rhodococcus sp. BP-322]MBY6439965.1 iron ABC transporter permease [Rhodococcus sp. BP-319]
MSVRTTFSGVTGLRIALWLVVAAVVLFPIGAVVSIGLGGNHIQELFDAGIVDAAINSAVSSSVSAALAVLLAVVMALALDRTDLPGRSVLRLILLSPLLIPPFVGAIAWAGLLGPSGSVNKWWESMFSSPLWNIYGGDGVIFLLTIHSYPVAYLIVSAAVKRIPAELEQAARISGATPWAAMRGVTLPLLRPAAVASFTLVAVSNLADFGIPALVGLPDRYVTLSTMVYRFIQSGTVAKPLEVVSTIGIALLFLAVLAVAVDRLLAARSAHGIDGPTTSLQRLPLGRSRVVAAVGAWVIAAAITVLPILALATQALLPAPGIPLTWDNLTLDNITSAVTAPGTLVGIQNSVMLAVSAAVICGVVGLALGVLTTRTASRDNVGLDLVAMLPQAIPGLVIAVGWLIVGRYTGLFDTRWVILCAYVMAFLAIVVQAVRAPLTSTPIALEEAARSSGATPVRALYDVPWKMAIPAAVTGSVLVALTAVRELTMSVLLVAPGTQTLGVSIFNLQQAGDYNAAAALSLLVAFVGLAGLGLVAGATDRKKRA